MTHFYIEKHKKIHHDFPDSPIFGNRKYEHSRKKVILLRIHRNFILSISNYNTGKTGLRAEFEYSKISMV